MRLLTEKDFFFFFMILKKIAKMCPLLYKVSINKILQQNQATNLLVMVILRFDHH